MKVPSEGIATGVRNGRIQKIVKTSIFKRRENFNPFRTGFSKWTSIEKMEQCRGRMTDIGKGGYTEAQAVLIDASNSALHRTSIVMKLDIKSALKTVTVEACFCLRAISI